MNIDKISKEMTREEIQINKELWKEFLKGKAAVNCETENEAENFFKYCKEQNLHWSNGHDLIVDNMYLYGRNTCYKNEYNYGMSIGRNIDYYNNFKIITYQQLINPNTKEEKKTYKGWEILKMIGEGSLKEGDKYIRLPFKNCDNKVIQETTFIIGGNMGMPNIDSFIKHSFKIKIKEKQYMTFDEVVKTGKNFKYRTWGTYFPLIDVIFEIKDIDEDRLEEMLKEKSWEVES